MAAAVEEERFDYVVVGSGAGGGPVAANLAKAGLRVLLLEAGSDAQNYHYEVPCFHGHASEDEEYSWEFFVRHYADESQQHKDDKFYANKGGVFYPRAGTLGGCTAHNAMITVYPHNQDWDDIAELTGDKSWRSPKMRRYFQRLERCTYARRPWAFRGHRILSALLRHVPWLSWISKDRGRHGFRGWLQTSLPDPTVVLPDWELVDVVLSAARDAFEAHLGRGLELLEDLVLLNPKAYVDPNEWSAVKRSAEGLWLTPLATARGRRNGTRELIKRTAEVLPDHLTVRTNCLVTRVVLDDDKRAVAVEYVEGAHLYAADPRRVPLEDRPRLRVGVDREVIVSGGAFNTPQILKLSGIGPREELSEHGIETLVDLPGVGENLQDRYEVGVIYEMDRDFSSLENATFDSPLPGAEPDRYFTEWLGGKGLYCSNGAVLAIIKRSSADKSLPDLFIFGLPASFRGYYPGYSNDLERHRNFFTWAILKAHTQNTAGTVKLRSDDPCDTPDVNFHYFQEGTDGGTDDLDAVVDGVEFARSAMGGARGLIHTEKLPGPQAATREQLREFVRDNAWGHHASCTCKIGTADDPMAVVDSNFRVFGTKGLRVVDASVFPRIPGFFIVTPVYMIAEKASDAILADVPLPDRVRRGTHGISIRALNSTRGRMRRARNRLVSREGASSES